MGRGSRDGGRGRRGEERGKGWKESVHVPTAHKECNHHLLQACINKKLKIKNFLKELK